MKIAIDAMGGDHAPMEIVKGSIDALKSIKGDLVFYGDEEKIKIELSKYSYDESRVSIHHTSELILNEDKPVQAIRRKKDSSMVVGLLDLKEKNVDCFISAGNTGAVLAGGLLKVGRIKGIDRPCLCSVYPTYKGISVLTDAGANADCKPRNLYEFAWMGSVYAEKVLDIDKPKVGLVNIGAEQGKGNALVNEVYPLLEESELNFVGNAEGRDLPSGDYDVIVADGFTGNVILKLSEGVVKTFSSILKDAIMSSFTGKIGGALLKGSLGNMKKKMDYTEYGGAPLLGVEGIVVKAHGSSNAKAFMNAIRYAEKCVDQDVLGAIKDGLLE